MGIREKEIKKHEKEERAKTEEAISKSYELEDSALKLAEQSSHIAYDPVADKKLLRKIDLLLLPLIGLLYAVQYMDKVSISTAAIIGLKQYYHMHGDMYSWCGSVFYLGYLLFEFPASVLLQRFPVSKTVSSFIIGWGIVIFLLAVAQNYAGFLVLRILLGCFESAITPAMVIITGQWYRVEEQFVRTSFWFGCNGLGIILGNAIGYGVAENRYGYPIEAFKILFIVMGSLTVFIGIVFIFHIPDDPSKAWFLNEKEKQMVIERIRSNQQGFGNNHFKKYQFIETLKDPITWLMALYELVSDIPNGAMTNFSSILLNDTFGYSTTQAMLMGMPAGAIELVGCFVAATLTPIIHNRRLLVALIGIAVTLLGACMLAWAPKKAALAGYYVYQFSAMGMITLLSLISSNVAGHTKKVSVNAIFLIGYCVGNLIGPQTFIESEAPGYKTGKICIVAMFTAAFIVVAIIYFIFWRRNVQKQKDIDAQTERVREVAAMKNSEFADMTDLENPFFKYAL